MRGGYIHANNGKYSVMGMNGKYILINRANFPITINKHGERGTLLAVSYYISNGNFRSYLGDDCEQEIKLAIGERIVRK